MSVRVKICGITHPDDALAAVRAGADALGFVFCETSVRCVQPEVAARIVQMLPPFVAKVGLFVDASEEFVRSVIARCGFDTVQFHGDESPEFCKKFAVKVIKAFRMRDERSLAALPNYAADAYLLDSYVPGKPGGTGEQFNWDLAVRAKRVGRPIVLAGGLNSENVGQAVRQVQPYAVDVSSGVELKPGRKDHARMAIFIDAAKAAARVH
jgi:phosphoribosylanthranilate isomerase